MLTTLILLAGIARADEPISNVVGGERAPPGAWDDAAAIGYSYGIGCTGTLIAPDLVITAGHCAYGIRYVIVGTTDYESGGERIRVIATHEHPDSQRTYDVAVVELETPATVAPRPLALDCVATRDVIDGAEVAIVGYGATNEGASQYDSLLMQAFTTIRDADCSDASRGCEPSVMPGGELIAGGDGVDSCNGDSGGPLYLLTDKGVWLTGVTSRAAFPANSPCGDGGIYVRVDAVADWIETATGRVLERPDCGDLPENHPPAPTVEPIAVNQGQTGTTVVLANDPDAGDAHVFAVLEPPLGRVELSSDGILAYTAPDDHEGADDFVVVVTDDGYPPATAEIVVPVMVEAADEPIDTDATDTDDDEIVLRARGTCGCAAAPASALTLAWLPLLLLRRVTGRCPCRLPRTRR